MPKNIGLLLPNQPTESAPTRFIPIEEARELKRQKRGVFVDHGQKFRLHETGKTWEDGQPLTAPKSFHGQSCVIDDKPAPTYHGMMLRFVQGDYFAHAAVTAWRFNPI
jgi:hypothetical protein